MIGNGPRREKANHAKRHMRADSAASDSAAEKRTARSASEDWSSPSLALRADVLFLVVAEVVRLLTVLRYVFGTLTSSATPI